MNVCVCVCVCVCEGVIFYVLSWLFIFVFYLLFFVTLESLTLFISVYLRFLQLLHTGTCVHIIMSFILHFSFYIISRTYVLKFPNSYRYVFNLLSFYILPYCLFIYSHNSCLQFRSFRLFIQLLSQHIIQCLAKLTNFISRHRRF